jgi:hypothetical protein
MFVFFFRHIRARSNSRVSGQIKCIESDIVEDLLRGKKNPVQCLNEYCSMTKKAIVYTETGSGYRYANYATIDDIQFPQVKYNIQLMYVCCTCYRSCFHY